MLSFELTIVIRGIPETDLPSLVFNNVVNYKIILVGMTWAGRSVRSFYYFPLKTKIAIGIYKIIPIALSSGSRQYWKLYPFGDLETIILFLSTFVLGKLVIVSRSLGKQFLNLPSCYIVVIILLFIFNDNNTEGVIIMVRYIIMP